MTNVSRELLANNYSFLFPFMLLIHPDRLVLMGLLMLEVISGCCHRGSGCIDNDSSIGAHVELATGRADICYMISESL